MAPSDIFLIETIAGYCDDIESAVERFSIDKNTVSEDADMRALMAFFVQQIGETANKLSPDFRKAYPEIEWDAIVGFRHHIVHAYGKIIPKILWDTITDDIPKLHGFCNQIKTSES
ncbi:DUF86 domain-containing protein [Candidatus Saccharibacteria bacterium]|nr:DUF86 domain-containing protein [Candidatus Saccharibacteria bacterium]